MQRLTVRIMVAEGRASRNRPSIPHQPYPQSWQCRSLYGFTAEKGPSRLEVGGASKTQFHRPGPCQGWCCKGGTRTPRDSRGRSVIWRTCAKSEEQRFLHVPCMNSKCMHGGSCSEMKLHYHNRTRQDSTVAAKTAP
jgi:hypothetical protein